MKTLLRFLRLVLCAPFFAIGFIGGGILACFICGGKGWNRLDVWLNKD